jgi:hypothetical protein
MGFASGATVGSAPKKPSTPLTNPPKPLMLPGAMFIALRGELRSIAAHVDGVRPQTGCVDVASAYLSVGFLAPDLACGRRGTESHRTDALTTD